MKNIQNSALKTKEIRISKTQHSKFGPSHAFAKNAFKSPRSIFS